MSLLMPIAVSQLNVHINPVKEDQFYKILVGGDQLTAARARSSKKHMINANTPQVRLEGLVPMVEDWHSKACFARGKLYCYIS